VFNQPNDYIRQLNNPAMRKHALAGVRSCQIRRGCVLFNYKDAQMKDLLLVFFIALCRISTAQSDREYININYEEGVPCSIGLLASGNYYINFIDPFGDSYEYFYFSFGKYQINEKEVILIDSLHKMKMRAIINVDELQFVNGFERSFFIKTSNPFPLGEINYSRRENIIATTKNELAIKKMINYCFTPVKSGFYSNIVGYELCLNSDNTYSYEFRHTFHSSGEWVQLGNEILLWDDQLNTRFSLLVEQKGLRSALLPGDYYGCLLTPAVSK
jgi:hypothetical protein